MLDWQEKLKLQKKALLDEDVGLASFMSDLFLLIDTNLFFLCVYSQNILGGY